MTSTPEERARTRAEPLPEERAAGDVTDRRDEAEQILEESEERIAATLHGDAPSDAAEEHRDSAEGV
jgi:hypothetical protein